MLDSILDGDATSNVAMFHSKTPEALKTKVLHNFAPMDGPLRVVVATTAQMWKGCAIFAYLIP